MLILLRISIFTSLLLDSAGRGKENFLSSLRENPRREPKGGEDETYRT
jgi:hypothetical protein